MSEAVKLTLFGKDVTVRGGPYGAKPEGYRGICMAAELKVKPGDLKVPVKNWTAPQFSQITVALRWLKKEVEGGTDKIYVGCRGGKGRTGTMMAILIGLSELQSATFTTGESLIDLVRRKYRSDSIETESQILFVRRFDWYSCMEIIARDWPGKT